MRYRATNNTSRSAASTIINTAPITRSKWWVFNFIVVQPPARSEVVVGVVLGTRGVGRRFTGFLFLFYLDLYNNLLL